MMIKKRTQERTVIREHERIDARYELSKIMGPDFFEPGMMEYPEQSDGQGMIFGTMSFLFSFKFAQLILRYPVITVAMDAECT